MFNIYWSTDIQNLKKSIKVVLTDLIKIREKTLSVAQLNRYKTQFKGQLIMAEESKSGMMLMIARSILDLGKVDSLEEVLATIEAITPQDIQQIAKALFEPDNLSWLIYEPKEE
jgi:predicted Zn-dependent peptidase